MQQDSRTERLGMFQIAILILSLVLLLGLVAETFLPLPREVGRMFQFFDTIICLIFLWDFCIRFYRAEDRLRFLKWGWIDLVASIPNLDVLRWGRLVRILRVIRLLRGIRSIQRLLQMLMGNRVESGAVALTLTAFLLIVFSASSILVVEQDSNSNIKTAEDAIWWAVSTITTVGYGDKYPVTSEGRCLGILLMLTGVGMFGGLSGLVASVFLEKRERSSPEFAEIMRHLAELQGKIDRLQKESGGPDGRPEKPESL
jgi:voltage-gated potassium channel